MNTPEASMLGMISDADLKALGLQTFSLGLQFQMMILQKQSDAVQAMVAALKNGTSTDHINVNHLPKIQPALGAPEYVRGSRAMGPIGIRMLEWIKSHDGVFDAIEFLKENDDISPSLTYAGNMSKPLERMLDKVPGSARIWKLKDGADTSYKLRKKPTKPSRSMGTVGQQMLAWAKAHGGILDMPEFRKANPQIPPTKTYTTNLSKPLARLVDKIPGETSVFRLKGTEAVEENSKSAAVVKVAKAGPGRPKKGRVPMDTTETPVFARRKDGYRVQLDGMGLKMYNWAVAHGGRFDVEAFRADNPSHLGRSLQPKSNSTLFASMIIPTKERGVYLLKKSGNGAGEQRKAGKGDRRLGHSTTQYIGTYGKWGQKLYDWAVAHGGVLNLTEFTKANPDVPSHAAFESNFTKALRRKLVKDRDDDRIFHLKPEIKMEQIEEPAEGQTETQGDETA